MCVLFIPEEIPQHTSGDEYLWKGNKPSEHFAIKGILWKRVHNAHRAAHADKLPRLAVQLPAQSQHVPLAGIKMFSIRLLHFYTTFILRGFICTNVLRHYSVVCVCVYAHKVCLSWEVLVSF